MKEFKFEDYPLLAVCDCLFKIFADTFRIFALQDEARLGNKGHSEGDQKCVERLEYLEDIHVDMKIILKCM
jgi:hypothetical protein